MSGSHMSNVRSSNLYFYSCMLRLQESNQTKLENDVHIRMYTLECVYVGIEDNSFH